MKNSVLSVFVALLCLIVITSAVQDETCYTRTIPNKKAVPSSDDSSIQYSTSQQVDQYKCRDVCEQDPTCRLVTFKKNSHGSSGVCTKYFNKSTVTRISDPNYVMFEKMCSRGFGLYY